MKLTANYLLDLARSIGRSAPEFGDNELDFPSIVAPTVELESPLDVGAAPNVTTPQNGTWQRNDFNAVIGGAGAATVDIGNLANGLWELDVLITVCTNFVRTAAVLFPIHIRMEVPAVVGNSIYLLGLYENGTVAVPECQTVQTKIRLLLSQPSNQIKYNINNNAAGQITLFSSRVLARKLL